MILTLEHSVSWLLRFMAESADDWKVNPTGVQGADASDAGGRWSGSNVDSDVVLEGELLTRGPVKLDGKFNGQLSCGETLSIGSTGVVRGEVETVNVVIRGKLEGNLLARKRLEIEPGGSFSGDLVVQPEVLVLAEAAQFARERPKPHSEPSGKVVEIPTGPSQGTRSG